MKVIRDIAAGTVTFLPSTNIERGALEWIASTTPISARFKYLGYDEPVHNDLELRFRFGDRTGSFHLDVRGDAEDDRKTVGALRDVLFYGSGELIFLGAPSYDGIRGALLTAGYCKHCSATMIDRVSCEWDTCDACAARCAHEYERGAVHGGHALVEINEYCVRCGRVQPSDQPPRTAEDQIREAEQELGVIVLENASPHEIRQHLRALVDEPS